jgi:hypothetical protein
VCRGTALLPGFGLVESASVMGEITDLASRYNEVSMAICMGHEQRTQ